MATDAQIFISFPGEDRKVAMTLCTALENRGFTCWISSRDISPGENFQSAIVRAIRKAKVMLLVFTANSNRSEEMNKELALAGQQKLPVIPLRVEDVTPNDAFAYEFATRQWIDAFADWEYAIDQLTRQIATIVPVQAAAPRTVAAETAPQAAPAPTPIPTPVPEPPLSAVPPPVEPLRAAAAAPEPSAPPAAKKSKRALGWTLAAVAVAALAAAAFIALPRSKPSPAPPAALRAAVDKPSAAVALATPLPTTPAPVAAAQPPEVATDPAADAASAADEAPAAVVRPRAKRAAHPKGAPNRATRSDLLY